jgi:hypothetical protein
MYKDFFLGVQEVSSAPSIQLLRDEEGQEYTTNTTMADYAMQYCQALFILQGSSPDCETTRRHVWSHVPRKVTTNMNSTLCCPLTIEEIHTALKSLLTGRALGIDGLPAEFFVAMWETLGTDFEKAYDRVELEFLEGTMDGLGFD